MLAFHLAETIAALFRHVLHHPSKVLYDPETEPLFLPLFWLYPIYREMLNSASTHRPSKSMELRRAASGLVKVICRTEESRPNGPGKKPGKPSLLASRSGLDPVETLCLDVPLLDPTGDFSGPRAPGSFLPVKDVWISYCWFLRQTSHITRLNGFNDRGTPAGRFFFFFFSR